MQSSVSLVIPFHNRETLLPRTLKSVAESSLFPAHVVLVDNGSTDSSPDVCRQWMAGHAGRRITLVGESAPGASAARNRGLREVDTPWVFFFDSDDMLDKDFLSDLQPRLTETLDLVAVPTRMEVDGRAGVRRFRPTDDPVCQILYSHLNTQAMVFRTGFLRRIGGWDARCMIWNDWELGLRALLGKPRMRWFTDKAYHLIRVHPDSITGSGYRGRAGGMLRALRIVADDIRSANPDAPSRRRLQKALFLRYALLAGRLRAEGEKDDARICLQQRKELFGEVAVGLRIEARIIEILTSCRLPGTWRLAMAMV